MERRISYEFSGKIGLVTHDLHEEIKNEMIRRWIIEIKEGE